MQTNPSSRARIATSSFFPMCTTHNLVASSNISVAFLVTWLSGGADVAGCRPAHSNAAQAVVELSGSDVVRRSGAPRVPLGLAEIGGCGALLWTGGGGHRLGFRRWSTRNTYSSRFA